MRKWVAVCPTFIYGGQMERPFSEDGRVMIHADHQNTPTTVRCLCKIALNYMALTQGPQFVLSASFDSLRSFIRYEMGGAEGRDVCETQAHHCPGNPLYYGTANTALIESLVANFDEYLGKFVYTAVSNVSKEFSEIDENCEKHFQDVPDILKQYRDKYKKLLDNPNSLAGPSIDRQNGYSARQKRQIGIAESASV